MSFSGVLNRYPWPLRPLASALCLATFLYGCNGSRTEPTVASANRPPRPVDLVKIIRYGDTMLVIGRRSIVGVVKPDYIFTLDEHWDLPYADMGIGRLSRLKDLALALRASAAARGKELVAIVQSRPPKSERWRRVLEVARDGSWGDKAKLGLCTALFLLETPESTTWPGAILQELRSLGFRIVIERGEGTPETKERKGISAFRKSNVTTLTN